MHRTKSRIHLGISVLFLLAWMGLVPALAEESERVIVVKAGRIYPVSGEPIDNGVIVIRDGKIEAVGSNVDYPHSARVIHAEDQVVMPGLINPATLMGVKPFSRNGVHADLKASEGFEFDEKTYDKLLALGFTTFGLLPTGKNFPGQAAAFKSVWTDRTDWLLNEAAYVLATLTDPSREKIAFKTAFSTADKEIEKVEKARKEWQEKQKKAAEEKQKAGDDQKKPVPEKPSPEQKEPEKKPAGALKEENPAKKPTDQAKAKTEEKAKEPAVFTPPPINPPYLPLVELIQKKEGALALVVLDQASDFVHLKEALGEREINVAYRLINSRSYLARPPGNDILEVSDRLGEEKARIVLNALINFKPYTSHRINLPAALTAAGCEVSLVPPKDDLAGHVGFSHQLQLLVKGGLSLANALKATTLHPARILGIDSRVGSLEKGKDADLLFLTGPPFSALTRVKQVMIEGEMVAEGRLLQ